MFIEAGHGFLSRGTQFVAVILLGRRVIFFFPGEELLAKMGRERHWDEGLMVGVGEVGWHLYDLKADRPDQGGGKERQERHGGMKYSLCSSGPRVCIV